MFQPVPQVLQHASYIPAQAAEIVAERDLSVPSFEGAPFDIQIGEAPVQTFVPEPGETHAVFFARIASSNVVDEHGKNPLSISMEPFRVVFRSKARVRLSGIFAGPFFFGDQDASPVPARVIDTTTDNVRHRDEILSDVVDGLVARHSDPRTVVTGLRSHEAGASLVSLGATEGDTIAVYHGDSFGEFLIEPHSTAFDFVGFATGPALNTAPGSHVVAYLDNNFQNVVVLSKRSQPVSIQATRSATFAALFGALPA